MNHNLSIAVHTVETPVRQTRKETQIYRAPHTLTDKRLFILLNTGE